MTYGQLLASLTRLVDRTDISDLMPDFVRRAHDVITDQVALVSPVTISNGEASAPADFSQVVAVWVDGSPRAFVMDGAKIRVAIGAPGNVTGHLVYRQAKPFFASEAATNIILTTYPWLYRYGALAEAGRYTYDDNLTQNEGLFRDEIARISAASVAAATGSISPR